MIYLKVSSEWHQQSSWTKIDSRPSMKHIVGYRSSGHDYAVKEFISRYLISRFGKSKHALITLCSIQTINNHNPYREIQYNK